jgi:hypothetical protein
MEIKQDYKYEYRTVGVVGSTSFCVILLKQYAINLGMGKSDFVKVRQEKNSKYHDKLNIEFISKYRGNSRKQMKSDEIRWKPYGNR